MAMGTQRVHIVMEKRAYQIEPKRIKVDLSQWTPPVLLLGGVGAIGYGVAKKNWAIAGVGVAAAVGVVYWGLANMWN